MSIFILIWATGLGNKLSNKISQELYTGNFKARIELNKSGIEGFIKRHPITGTGLRNSRIYTTHPSVYPAHNAFIQVADELGIFGFLFYALIHVYLLGRLILTHLILKKFEDKIIIQALIAGLVLFIIISQLEPLAYNFWFWVYFGLIESSAICLLTNEQKIE
jgi:O-antigen ligase